MTVGADVSPVLAIRGAVKTYGAREAVRGVSLAIGAGRIHALLGPNGAGKTTLIRAICGRVALDDGSVSVEGRDPRSDPSVRASIGLVPQEIALYPTLTVRENLEVLGRLAGLPRAELSAATERALDWSGLTDRAGDRCESLSGGMKRRLNIVAGTLHRPRVVLLDEPTVGVDPAARDRIHELLRALRDDGVGLLLTTHDMEEAEALADHVALLVEGTVRAEGAPAALVRERFGDADELRVRLPQAPRAADVRVLEAAGLSSHAESTVWSGRWREGLEGAGRLERELADGGTRPSEVRLTEPGLREVFFDVAGREIGA